MRLRGLLFAVIFLLSLHAKAQIGLYGTVTTSRASGIVPPYPYTGTHSFWTYGASFGGYGNLIHFGPTRLGADVRGNILNSQGHKLNSVLVGPRFAFQPEVVPLRPYLQASFGRGSTNFGGGSVVVSGFQYHIAGGFDFTLFPRLDWRVVEVGGGALRTNSRTGSNIPTATVSTGIVFRLR